MDIQSYIDNKKNLYDNLLIFIDNEDNEESKTKFSNLIQEINTQNIINDSAEFKLFIHLISIITANHHRNTHFYDNIEEILTEYSDKIKQTYSNSEIYKIFKKNKRITYFLIEKGIITIDKEIYDNIDKNDYYYFYPELNNFLDEKSKEYYKPKDINKFNKKRKIGENDSYICQLIRQDSVEEFIIYITRNNISINSTIKSSIFETNLFLIKKTPTLIEYAVFFGSIQIVQYLQSNNAQLDSSLWLYAIHSNNAEVIEFLENYCSPLSEYDNKTCLKKAIECHHNGIAEYIDYNYVNDKILVKNFYNNILSYAFHYNNCYFFMNEMDHKLTFFYLCQYNYKNLVKLFLKYKKFDINRYFVLFYFFRKFVFKFFL